MPAAPNIDTMELGSKRCTYAAIAPPEVPSFGFEDTIGTSSQGDSFPPARASSAVSCALTPMLAAGNAQHAIATSRPGILDVSTCWRHSRNSPPLARVLRWV